MRIAVLDDYQGVAAKNAELLNIRDKLKFTFFNDHVVDETAIAERLNEFEIICIMRERTPFSASLIQKLPKLKLLITSGMRNLSIDFKAAKKNGVVVCGTPSVGRPTAELAWGLILGLARQIPMEDRCIRAGGWQNSMGISLEGKIIGIVGLGNLGSRMASIAKSFKMTPIAWSPNLDVERCAKHDVEFVSKNELLTRSDFITIHLILSKSTRGIFQEEDLEKKKRFEGNLSDINLPDIN